MKNLTDKIKVSIIMAVYNSAETLREAIDSIINQTFKNWEFIICDDCSIDNTVDIIGDYVAKYPDKIVLIRNSVNSKLAFSLNHCLKYAKGEYVARMDGDDISVVNRLEEQVHFLESNPEYDVVGTGMIPFDENGERKPRFKKVIPEKLDLIIGPTFNHATIMMRKKAYDALGGYTVSSRTVRTQDYDLWFRFFHAGFRGFNMQEPLYKVREGLNDYKRRTWKLRWQAVKIRWYGFQLLGFPFYYYVYAFKPIFVGLIPKRLLFAFK